jgi:hypothetical protein
MGEGRASEGAAGMEIGVQRQSDVRAGGFRERKKGRGADARGRGADARRSGETTYQVFVVSSFFLGVEIYIYM